MASTTRSARRRKARDEGLVVVGIVALFAVVTIVRWVAAHLPLTIGIVLAVSTVAGGIALRRRHISRLRSVSAAALQRMGDKEFEYALADLCRRNGCTNVQVVGGGGDLAADVLAKLPGRRWWQFWKPGRQRILIQAKRYGPNTQVRSEHVQMVNGTYRDIHRCDQAAIVTTSTATRDARALAKRLGIALYEEAQTAGWASRTGPPPWM